MIIGNTPLRNWGCIWYKCEHYNPSGSIKDRVIAEFLAKYGKGEDRHYTVATTGNTGIALAMAAAYYGFQATIVIPYTTSRMKAKAIGAYGSNIALGADVAECITIAKSIAEETHGRYLDQFGSDCNFWSQAMMAKEIWQKNHSPDVVIAGVGTGGTLAGLSYVFPNAKVYQVVGNELEGICDGVRTPLIPRDKHITQIPVTLHEAKYSARMMAEQRGEHVGITAGANMYGASIVAAIERAKNIVTVLPDAGWRYLC